MSPHDRHDSTASSDHYHTQVTTCTRTRSEIAGTITPALAKLASHERYLAAELQGRRYDLGLKYGLLTAQLALALNGQDRDEVLSGLVEMLARREA